jgi:hypothetical protein
MNKLCSLSRLKVNKSKTENMKILHILLILLISYIQIPETALANSSVSSCSPVNAIERKLKKQKSSSSLNVRKVATSEYWRGAPKGVLLDISTVNIDTSPEFNLAYSKQIISQCAGVVAVRFSMYRSDAGHAYGLVKGRVKRFECPSGKTVADQPFKWGYECLP